MATVTKSLSSKIDPEGYSQVLFLIRNGSSFRLRTKSGIMVPAKQWNQKKGCLSIPRVATDEVKASLVHLNEQLEITTMRTLKLIGIYGENVTKQFMEETITKLRDYEGVITKEVVEDILHPTRKNKEGTKIEELPSFFEAADIFLMKHPLSDPRKRSYRVVFRSMARYQVYRKKIVHSPFKWDWNTTTKSDVEGYYAFMEEEHIYRKEKPEWFEDVKKIYPEKSFVSKDKHKNPRIEARGENRLVGMKKACKAFWNWAMKSGYTSNNPFYGIEIGSENYGTPFYITIEERNKVAEHDFSDKPKLEVQRDIFVFQCMVGCRVGDLTKLTEKNIVNGILMYEPHKTIDNKSSFTAKVPLSNQALALIDKYRGKDTKGRLFPFIADQNYNEAIKEILTACEITRMVNIRDPKSGESVMMPINEICSSHMARRTFVGNVYKKVKDPNIIGRMSGHVEGSQAFVRYRDIDDDMLRDVIKEIE